MRNFIFSTFLILAAIFALNLPNFALADSAEKPLMIIRFTSDIVDYEQNLDKAVKMAVDKKPKVLFNLVAVTPETNDKNINKQNEKEAKFLVEKVADQIKQSGVSADMISTSLKSSKSVKAKEIQIFIQ